jgi:hypothetical protein
MPTRRTNDYENTPGRIALLCGAGDFTIEAAQAEGEGETVPRFTMVAYSGDAMQVEGWRYPVVVDLEGLVIPSQRRPVRFGHSMYAGVGFPCRDAPHRKAECISLRRLCAKALTVASAPTHL